MPRLRRAIAQARNVALDIRYCGRPLRDLRNVKTTSAEVFAPHSADYQILRSVFTRYPVQASDTFVDVGCGYGRVLLAAAHQAPQARIVGIEGIPQIAVKAKQATRRAKTVQVVEGWAPEAIPPEVTYAFMFNPFPADIALGVLSHIADCSASRSCQVVMVNPAGAEVIATAGTTQANFRVSRSFLQGTGLLAGHQVEVTHLQRKLVNR